MEVTGKKKSHIAGNRIHRISFAGIGRYEFWVPGLAKDTGKRVNFLPVRLIFAQAPNPKTKIFPGVLFFSRVWAPCPGGVGPYGGQPGATGVPTGPSGVPTSPIPPGMAIGSGTARLRSLAHRPPSIVPYYPPPHSPRCPPRAPRHPTSPAGF